jgi:hypothetical protein
VIPPKQSADFVYHMEQVLAVYERPYDEQFPVVCVDESPKQLLEIKQYRAMDGTRIEDSEYIRHGVGEIYMAFEPLAGQRFVTVKDDHKAITWVSVLANLLDGPYVKCVKMTVVGDNLSAHKPSAFYTVFGSEKAKAYLDRLEFIYTPKHGSWLDMAEPGGRSHRTVYLTTGLSESSHCYQRVADSRSRGLANEAECQTS